jgi:hypothetical protein
MSALRGFAAFWYDFIVGDSWELAVGVFGLLIAAWVFDQVAPGAAERVLFVAMPAAVIAVLGISLARADK